jgi:ferredoxin
MKRKIIHIDEDMCDGCGECIPECPEGAIQIIDGKARLVSDLFCDGLGACLGSCPNDAITIEEREAEPYDERLVMERIVEGGPSLIEAHLRHLKDHGATDYLQEAVSYLEENGIDVPTITGGEAHACAGTCPGREARTLETTEGEERAASTASRLGHWPVQLHLLSPIAPYFKEADVLLVADCVAYALAGFHDRFLAGKSIAIACPKLDSNKDAYIEKLRLMIDEAKINTLTVIKMEVPCCSGIVRLAQEAASRASRKVPIKSITVSIRGEIIDEKWL